MRLNRVESFYAFLLRFRSEGSPCKGQPSMATASPLARAAGHLQGGGRLPPRPAHKGAALAHGQIARAAVRGWPAAVRRPQGAADYGFGARRKVAYGQRHHPWRCRPQGWPPLGRVAVDGKG
ncbi:hypothetical protein BHE74_00053214 [Ensete ventricosum]|nr:hypothetical protein BHE74_00053214 [Ensete ventricosum]